MSVKWQKLSLSNERSLPPLLFKYSRTVGGYELYMTDLTCIWSERLNRQDILKRADDDNTTIDPSEDAEQFKVLLQKIGHALNHEPGSSTSLYSGSRGDTLELMVSSKLPAPLKPLKWKLYLSKEPQSSSTNHLLLPLIRAEATRELRQQDLIEQLNRKDWILGKLLDKIESMAVDLTTIFPGTSGLRAGRKGPTLSHPLKYISGLAPFNEHAWLEETNKVSPDSGLAANIASEILNGSGDSRSEGALNPPPDEWWVNLAMNDSTTHVLSDEEEKQTVAEKSSKDTMETDTDARTETEDDEFERQDTPPRLKKLDDTSRRISSPWEDQEASLYPDSNKKGGTVINPLKRPTGKPKGLGMISGKKQNKQKPALASPPPVSSRHATHEPTRSPSKRKSPVDENETDSGTDIDGKIPKKPLSPPVVAVQEQASTGTTPKTSRGLGLIGGKKRGKQGIRNEPQLSELSEPPAAKFTPDPPSPPQIPSDVKKKKPLGKLGVIGGKGARRNVEPSYSHTEIPPPTFKKEEDPMATGEDVKHTVTLRQSPASEERKEKPPQAESPKEETEQEKADRKREELKRQLEVKSKAPVKKKRRF